MILPYSADVSLNLLFVCFCVAKIAEWRVSEFRQLPNVVAEGAAVLGGGVVGLVEARSRRRCPRDSRHFAPDPRVRVRVPGCGAR